MGSAHSIQESHADRSDLIQDALQSNGEFLHGLRLVELLVHLAMVMQELFYRGQKPLESGPVHCALDNTVCFPLQTQRAEKYREISKCDIGVRLDYGISLAK